MSSSTETVATEFRQPLTNRIVMFLRDIGLPVLPHSIEEETVLPGILVREGALLVDEAKLLYPGDLLHEAGHLAVLRPHERAAIDNRFADELGNEITAIAWSYAALLHLKLKPAVVFHAAGYQGASKAFIENFANERYVGVPLLQYYGLTHEVKQAREQGVAPFPHMIRWLRDRQVRPPSSNEL